MGYFDHKNNVDDYIKMVDGFDGRALIKILEKYVEKKSSVLELGMGPGKDLNILGELYNVTGSDNSKIFIELFKTKNPEADLLILDAVTLETERKFDCIYSNKVLHHLDKEGLKKSFKRQSVLLNKNGLLFHSFWFGNKEEEMHGLKFVYYTFDTIRPTIGQNYDILEIQKYKEMEENDSFYIILKKKS